MICIAASHQLFSNPLSNQAEALTGVWVLESGDRLYGARSEHRMQMLFAPDCGLLCRRPDHTVCFAVPRAHQQDAHLHLTRTIITARPPAGVDYDKLLMDAAANGTIDGKALLEQALDARPGPSEPACLVWSSPV